MSIEPFVRCSDINVSLTFYCDVLDFKLLQAPDPEPAASMSMYAYLGREGSGVHLSQHAGDGVFGNVLYLEVQNLDALYQRFKDNGLRLQKLSGITLEPIEQSWGMKEFYVADPDGNRLRFGQRIA